MVGQKNLLKTLNGYSIDNFPKSTLFIGQKGCGKHTITSYLAADILHLEIIDITESISDELIQNIYRAPSAHIYLMDLSKITEKEQNIVLKLVEEPAENCFIVLLAEAENFVLPTILNRCIKFNFEPYSVDELKLFLPEGYPEKFLKILKTPGKILDSNMDILQETQDYAERIVDKIHLASYPNTLSIVNKINFSDEFNKFDFEILLDLLQETLFNRYFINNNIHTYNLYNIVLKLRESLLDKRIKREIFAQHLFTELWLYSKEHIHG